MSATKSVDCGIQDGILRVADRATLTGVPGHVHAEADGRGGGAFLSFSATAPAARHVFEVGAIVDLRRFTACHRYEPFWMKPCAGTRAGEIPHETQYLLCELLDGCCLLVVPLLDGPFRCSLQSGAGEKLAVCAESGDAWTAGTTIRGVYLAVGKDPYALMNDAAKVVATRLGARLRREKKLPDIAGLFGWCTWNAFYEEVSHDKVRAGLASFAAGGVQPRFLILDDGWQSVRPVADGRRLSSLRANGKFPGGLAATVRMAKDEFAILRFLVWHAIQGYWGGLDSGQLPGYRVRETVRSYSEGVLRMNPGWNHIQWGQGVGLVDPADIHRFYHDYHRALRAEGVDGVKVDNQASIEGLGHGLGGRLALTRAYREAMEGAAAVHFDGRLINCMSLSNDHIYGTQATSLMRSSTDFWPNDPLSHGLHLHTNAQAGMWFGEFIHPDWDMFESAHPQGAFHAAGRALSGGPIYVSDKPGEHDFTVLRKLVYRSGFVPHGYSGVGRPTRDCLFRDPVREDVLLKIFNRNACAGIIGAFNCHPRPASGAGQFIQGQVSPSDVPGLEGEEFAVYAHEAGTLRRCRRDEQIAISLREFEHEVFTISPVLRGVAPIGLTEKYNSAGVFLFVDFSREDICVLALEELDSPFLVFSERAPRRVLLRGTAVVRDITFRREATGALWVDLPSQGMGETLELHF